MIILTGASGGVGESILPLLSREDEVIAVYHSNKPKIKKSKNIYSYKLDLNSEEDILNFCDYVSSRPNNKKITLVHGAILSKDCLAANVSATLWDEVMSVNLRSVFILNREFLKMMVPKKWGRIIHFSSIAQERGVKGTLTYSTSKAALLGMSKVLATEYARFNITSNVISLGYFNVGLINKLNEDQVINIIKNIPSKKLGDILDIYNAINFLMKTSYANGSVLSLDGGY